MRPQPGCRVSRVSGRARASQATVSRLRCGCRGGSAAQERRRRLCRGGAAAGVPCGPPPHEVWPTCKLAATDVGRAIWRRLQRSHVLRTSARRARCGCMCPCRGGSGSVSGSNVPVEALARGGNCLTLGHLCKPATMGARRARTIRGVEAFHSKNHAK